MHSDTETCINALLDTSIKHSPNFDWVVAHVGSCFPHTVITRVLSCGLKDFCQIKSYEQGSNSPKLRSVVGILGHLAGSHSSDIQSAILEIFLVRIYWFLVFFRYWLLKLVLIHIRSAKKVVCSLVWNFFCICFTDNFFY